MLARLSLLAFVVMTLAGSTSALAQSQLMLTAPDPVPVNATSRLELVFSLDGGTYEDLALEITFPENVSFESSSYEDQTFSALDCDEDDTTGVTTCVLSNPFLDAGGGLAGTVTVDVKAARYAFEDGETLAFSAVVNASRYSGAHRS